MWVALLYGRGLKTYRRRQGYTDGKKISRNEEGTSMKKLLLLSMVVLAMATLSAGTALAAKGGKNAGCVTIPQGILTYSATHYLAGDPLQPGYDPYGYNYQAHLFNGTYANVYLGGAGFPAYMGNTVAYVAENPTVVTHWAWPYRDVNLGMKWNDAWIANTDCDDDGKLDRHYGFDSYIGSGAWETNHQSDTNLDGTKWTYFVKIIAVPGDAYRVGPANSGIWYTADDVEIGTDIWDQFAIIQEVYNDPSTGDHGLYYGSPAGPGFGKW